ncbi:MAG TPA: ABC transporter substrate-binding protein [Candidatus Acidoferrales bacterium]|nr:ABC transporter substrate-binding protein [Candidatus Acidoferrales bacterium]
MNRLALLLALLLTMISNRAWAQLQKFRAGNGGFGTAINAILPGAYHAKIFQKYGLDAEYIALESGTISMQTLLANELQVVFTTGALAVTANLQGGDTTIIAGGINFFPFKLIVRPEVRTGAELHGKKLAISRFGSASDYAAQLAVEKLGGDPKQVTMLQLGGNPSRLSALTSGTVHATVFSEPFASVAVKQGMRSLIDLADSGVSFPQNSFIVRRSVLAEKRPMIVNAIKASIETLYLLKRDRKFAREVLKKYLRIDDDAMIDIGIDYYLTRHGEGILTLPDRKGIEFVIADTARTNPKAKGQTPESLRVLDASVLDEIKKSGFIEKVKG